jgi:hypothetical protein
MVDLINLLAICVREFPTSFWAYIINGTEIVPTKKGARHGFKNLVPIFVNLKKFCLKGRKLHLEIFGDPCDIGFLKIGP